jgi:hypothetical protein
MLIADKYSSKLQHPRRRVLENLDHQLDGLGKAIDEDIRRNSGGLIANAEEKAFLETGIIPY